ncbi:MAG: sulfite exporter TauE/SafE family protein [Chloroflexi bacterium]|nr:sulfite exporter TauE/SafE family protein [Chloroflexota bacterium]
MEVGLLMLVGGVAAGAFGSLLGLGGGLLIVPLLTIGFGLPLREAVGVSLVCVIVTSSASASVYLERRQANLRLGMVLELFTAMGAIAGGLVAFLLDERLLAAIFAVVLVYVAITMLRSRPAQGDDAATAAAADGPSRSERLTGSAVRRVPAGLVGSVGAGVVSALLGIGGGIVKVPVMHLVMGVPLRVATATSNLMIGITASASAIVYLLRGGIDVNAAGPTALGVFVGATLGSRLGGRVRVGMLRALFVGVLLFTAFEMARRAVGLS